MRANLSMIGVVSTPPQHIMEEIKKAWQLGERESLETGCVESLLVVYVCLCVCVSLQSPIVPIAVPVPIRG